jgi:hypothetical protein
MTGHSPASFTTTSQIKTRAAAPSVGDRLHLHSEATDSGHATGSVHKRLINGGVGTGAEIGAEQGLHVDRGGFPDKKRTCDIPAYVTDVGGA